MTKKKQKLINGVYLKRPVDKNIKPIEGNVFLPYFSLEAIKHEQAKWDELNKNKKHKRRGNHGYDKAGWVPEFIRTFMRMHAYSEYTNITHVDPDKIEAVEATVYSRLEGFVENLRSDVNLNRAWCCTNYYIKNLQSSHGKKNTENTDKTTGVETANGPKAPKTPEQLLMDFSKEADVKTEEKTTEPVKKPKTYKKTIVKGEPEKECKTKDKVIDDIRHWQVENQKILHAEHGDITAKVASLSAVVNKLSVAIDRMEAKLNMVVAMSYNIDKLFKTWKPLPGKKA